MDPKLVAKTDDTLEFDVKDLGSNTLQGCLAFEDEATYKLYEIKGKHLIYNYDNMLIGHDELAEDLAWLYEHGAKRVTLIGWIAEHEKEFAGRVYTIPRTKRKR